MQKFLSDDQKNLLASLEDLQKHPGWKKILEIVEARIKELDLYLLGEVEMRNPHTGYIENLDEIKYSRNSILRSERKTLSDLIKKPEELIKTTGVIA